MMERSPGTNRGTHVRSAGIITFDRWAVPPASSGMASRSGRGPTDQNSAARTACPRWLFGDLLEAPARMDPGQRSSTRAPSEPCRRDLPHGFRAAAASATAPWDGERRTRPHTGLLQTQTAPTAAAPPALPRRLRPVRDQRCAFSRIMTALPVNTGKAKNISANSQSPAPACGRAKPVAVESPER